MCKFNLGSKTRRNTIFAATGMSAIGTVPASAALHQLASQELKKCTPSEAAESEEPCDNGLE